MLFCYFIVFGKVFTFISSFAPKSITVAPDIEAYFNFVLGMFLAFGLAFEVPVVVVLLVLTGIINTDQLREFRGYVIVAVDGKAVGDVGTTLSAIANVAPGRSVPVKVMRRTQELSLAVTVGKRKARARAEGE